MNFMKFLVIKYEGYSDIFKEIYRKNFLSLCEANNYIDDAKKKDYNDNLDYNDFFYQIKDEEDNEY